MENINNYKQRFYNLMESTLGNVKPLIIERVDIEHRPTIINGDGSVTINNIKKQPQRIKFSVEGPLYSGDVHVKDIFYNNGVYCIVTKKDIEQCFNKEQINDILSFVDSNKPTEIDFGMFKGKLKMKKI